MLVRFYPTPQKSVKNIIKNFWCICVLCVPNLYLEKSINLKFYHEHSIWNLDKSASKTWVEIAKLFQEILYD